MAHVNCHHNVDVKKAEYLKCIVFGKSKDGQYESYSSQAKEEVEHYGQFVIFSERCVDNTPPLNKNWVFTSFL